MKRLSFFGCSLLIFLMLPALSAALPYGDLNGDDAVNVVDVQLVIGLALGLPMSGALDSDGAKTGCSVISSGPHPGWVMVLGCWVWGLRRGGRFDGLR